MATVFKLLTRQDLPNRSLTVNFPFTVPSDWFTRQIKADIAAAKRGSRWKGRAERFPARGQVAYISVHRKSAPIKAENRIRFKIFDEVRRYDNLSIYYAFASDDLTLELFCGWGDPVRVRFNNNPNHPQIIELVPFLLGREPPRIEY